MEVIAVRKRALPAIKVVHIVLITDQEPRIRISQIVRQMRSKVKLRDNVYVVKVGAGEVLRLEYLIDNPAVAGIVQENLRHLDHRQARLIQKRVKRLKARLERQQIKVRIRGRT